MLLETELRLSGCEITPTDFRTLLAGVFAELFPGWTYDRLVHVPREAMRYCTVVRYRAKNKGLADPFILRSLANIRKRFGVPNPVARRGVRGVELAKELESHGSKLKPDQFVEVLAAVFCGLFQGHTDEQVLCSPRDALRFADAVRKATKLPDLGDTVILRAATNQRRRRRLYPGKAAREGQEVGAEEARAC